MARNRRTTQRDFRCFFCLFAHLLTISLSDSNSIHNIDSRSVAPPRSEKYLRSQPTLAAVIGNHRGFHIYWMIHISIFNVVVRDLSTNTSSQLRWALMTLSSPDWIQLVYRTKMISNGRFTANIFIWVIYAKASGNMMIMNDYANSLKITNIEWHGFVFNFRYIVHTPTTKP